MKSNKLTNKLILAASLCLAAILATFFDISGYDQAETKSNFKVEEKQARKVKTFDSSKSAINEPKEIIVHQKALAKADLENTRRDQNNSENKEDQSLGLSADPYKDLLDRISNQEFAATEEEKIESLKTYLDNTVKGSEYQEPEAPQNNNPQYNNYNSDAFAEQTSE